MANHNRFIQFVTLAGVSSVCLSSCTLPPEQAWRKIREDGLIAYWSYEAGSQHSDRAVSGEGSSRASSGTPAPVALPSPVIAQSPTKPAPVTNDATRPEITGSAKPLTAQSIPSLPGFVRSPYTNPPRLVDVKGAIPGSTMVCPYTQRSFIIPSDYVNAPGPMVAETNTKPSKPKDKPALASENTRRSTVAEVPQPPKVNKSEKPVEPAPKKVEPEKPVASVSAPPPSVPTIAPPPVTPKPVQDIPYGTAIGGRPGFVNSPFAAKHQLVDVTGLPTGMEVKCPYTGKLFRVPPQDVAATKPAETEKPQPAAPEEPKKN